MIRNCFVILLAVILPGQNSYTREAAENSAIVYTKAEELALRNEMIEMDIYLRTAASMIALNNPERLKFWIQRLSVSTMSESVYHKKGIEGVYAKWARRGAGKYLEAVRTESSSIMKKISASAEENGESGVNWDDILKSYVTIVENCRGCHFDLGVKVP